MSDKERTTFVKYYAGTSGSKLAHLRSEGESSAVLSVWIDGAGAAGEFLDDNIHTPGVAHLLEHICASRIASIAEKNGWLFDASTNFSAVKYQVQSPKMDFEKASQCLFDALSSPKKFLSKRATEIERAANELLRAKNLDPARMFMDRTLHAIYNHPTFQYNNVGAEADILSITNKDILRFWSSKYREGSFVIALSIDRAREDLEHVFASPSMNKGKNADMSLVFRPTDIRWPTRRDGVLFQLAYPVSQPSNIEDYCKKQFIQHFMYIVIDEEVRRRTRNYGIIRNWQGHTGYLRDSYNFVARSHDAGKILERVCYSLERMARTGTPAALRARVKSEVNRPCNGVSSNLTFHQEILPQLSRYGAFVTDCEKVTFSKTVTKEDVKREAQNILEGPLVFCAEGTLKGLPSRRQVAGIFGRKSLSF
ncbi:MAG TPA: hypothetical protein DCY07_01150 [Rhodospirillaceae bacterium]|nr:hypothetical protein [Rhodospirillaceae bacterium]